MLPDTRQRLEEAFRELQALVVSEPRPMLRYRHTFTRGQLASTGPSADGSMAPPCRRRRWAAAWLAARSWRRQRSRWRRRRRCLSDRAREEATEERRSKAQRDRIVCVNQTRHAGARGRA